MLWQQLLKRLLALDCASCEGFSTSGNAVVTSQEHAARTEDGWHELSCHGYYSIHGLEAFFQLRQSTAYHR